MTYLDVVTGFLGSGKTTFLAWYIRWLKKSGIRACVIENEFGRAGVDGALLKTTGVTLREISGGCVCCTLKVTLHQLLGELSEHYDRILLEPSGLFCGDDLMDILHSPDCRVLPGMWACIVDPMALSSMNDEDLAVLQSEMMQAGSVVASKTQLCSQEEPDSLSPLIARLLPAPRAGSLARKLGRSFGRSFLPRPAGRRHRRPAPSPPQVRPYLPVPKRHHRPQGSLCRSAPARGPGKDADPGRRVRTAAEGHPAPGTGGLLAGKRHPRVHQPRSPIR